MEIKIDVEIAGRPVGMWGVLIFLEKTLKLLSIRAYYGIVMLNKSAKY